MILENNTDLKEYVSIAQSFTFEDFIPYIQKAVNAFTKKYVGNLHVVLDSLSSGENSEIKNEAREYLRSSIANFGMYLFLPYLQVQMDSTGISVNVSENRKSPEWWQTKDIRRELLRSGHESMELLLEILDSNPTVFVDYAQNYSSLNSNLLVKNALDFTKYYNIFQNRQTYLALVPTLTKVEDQYLYTLLSKELIDDLKKTVTGIKQELKILLQKAIVAFTVAKTANTGLFVFDDRGLRIDFENMSDGRRENPSYGKSVDQLKLLAEEEINNGTQYLKLAVELIESNSEPFSTYANPLLKNAKIIPGYQAIKTSGVIGI